MIIDEIKPTNAFVNVFDIKCQDIYVFSNVAVAKISLFEQNEIDFNNAFVLTTDSARPGKLSEIEDFKNFCQKAIDTVCFETLPLNGDALRDMFDDSVLTRDEKAFWILEKSHEPDTVIKELESLKKLGGFYPEAINSNGDSFLHIAVNSDKKTVVKYLLESGVNPNMQDADGITPIFDCVGKNPDIDMARILLEGGANPNIADNNGRTPMHEASSGGPKQIVEIMLQHGGCAGVVNINNETPLDAAAKYYRQSIVELLQKHNTKEYILSAVSKNGSLYESLQKNYKTDMDIALAAIVAEPSVSLANIFDDSFYIEAINRNPKVMHLLPHSKVVELSKVDIEILSKLSATQKSNRALMVELVKTNPDAFRFASEALRLSPNFIGECAQYRNVDYALEQLKGVPLGAKFQNI